MTYETRMVRRGASPEPKSPFQAAVAVLGRGLLGVAAGLLLGGFLSILMLIMALFLAFGVDRPLNLGPFLDNNRRQLTMLLLVLLLVLLVAVGVLAYAG